MNRSNLLTGTVMTPVERQMGRFMRAPEHPDLGLGGESNPAENNQGGNSAESGASENPEDNTGADEGLEGFWEAKPEEDGSGESDEEVQQASQRLGGELGQLIQGFKSPETFTKEVADAIADGDLTGINTALAARDQQLLRHSTVVAAKMVEGLMGRMTADFEARIQKALGNKDNQVTLENHFPLAKDPAMKPMVQRVWDQALVNAKGDREKAITLTRGMLRAFGDKTSIREAPADSTAGVNTPASRSLAASLLERD